MSSFHHAFLHPLRSPLAGANEVLLGPLTLGIEVTEPELAARCGQGNIDPQHSGDGRDPRAAIEAALDWPLPPPGARLVTLRPDADALGAMAVLNLRAEGHVLCPHSLARVDAIARWDRLARGQWHDWQRAHPPLLRPALAVDLRGKPLEMKALDALVRIDAMELEERVRALAAWLRHGKAALPDAAVRAALEFEQSLLDAWNRRALVAQAGPDPRLALLTAEADAPMAGLDLAYRLAPVVLAEGHLPSGRKLTVAQFEPGWADLAALRRDLSALEPGWGGSATIIGSPQGQPSTLPLRAVAECLLRHLKRGR